MILNNNNNNNKKDIEKITQVRERLVFRPELIKYKKNKYNLSSRRELNKINYIFIIDVYSPDDKEGNFIVDSKNFNKITYFFTYTPYDNIISKVIKYLILNEDKNIEKINLDTLYNKKNTTQSEIIKLLNLFGYLRDNSYSNKKHNEILKNYKYLINGDDNEETISEE